MRKRAHRAPVLNVWQWSCFLPSCEALVSDYSPLRHQYYLPQREIHHQETLSRITRHQQERIKHFSRYSDRSMASIQSLLNPEPPIDSQPDPRCQDASPPPPSPPLAANSQGPKANGYRDRTSSSGVTSQQQPQPRTRKSRVPKDAPVFVRGSIRGELRYPPCEERDEKLSEEHRRFQLYPMGEIAEYPRHIPYSSDKKSFMHRTGRDYFEGMLDHHCPLS